MKRSKIHAYIDSNIDKHVDHLRTWVRQPSVSWDNWGVSEMAELVAQSYRDLGCQEVEIIEGRYHPGVWAYYDAGSPVTVHNYCMFDTRTVKEKDWTIDPWAGEIHSLDNHPKVLVGPSGAKGPYVAFLNALQSIIAVEGTLPVNIMFLAEGDEILGSPSYRDYVERYRDRLKQVKASYCASGSQNGRKVSVGLGLKGMVVLELTVSGEAWGKGPAKTIHSSQASGVGSPPFRLAQALATMTNADGSGCTVDGLKEIWNYRKPLTADEQAQLDALAQSGAGDRVSLENLLYGPTFNVAGLRSGFLGFETETIPFIVPATATATLDMRMVIELTADEIIGALRSHLDGRGFADIAITTLAAFSHSQTSVADPGVQAVLKTIRDHDMVPVVWPIQAGGGPWTAVPNAFGVPCIHGGAIGGGGSGKGYEYFIIESGSDKTAGLADAEKYHVDLLYNFARSAGAKV